MTVMKLFFDDVDYVGINGISDNSLLTYFKLNLYKYIFDNPIYIFDNSINIF
jgi:hypothetical protein